MKRLTVILITLLIIAYPFAVYFGLNHVSPRYIALSLGFIILLRFVLIAPKQKPTTKVSLILITLAGAILCLSGAISNQILIIKLYPVAISLMLLVTFYYSLLHPPTIIERFARIKEANLSAAAINYTQKITIIWCSFFAINGLIALWTALAQNAKIWAIYNGLISYILIGALFVTEFIYRQYAKRKNYL